MWLCGTAAATPNTHQENHSALRITVLGTSPSWQDADGVCSGYLVETPDACILLDCGSGVFGRLRAHRAYDDVDAVVISHLHADHVFDVIPYAYALTYSPHRRRADGEPPAHRPRLLVPPGARETLAQISGTWNQSDLVEQAFDLEEYDPAASVEIGSLRLRFQPVTHYIPTYAIDVVSTSNGSGRLTFGADTAPDDGLVEFAHETDLMLLEATLSTPEGNDPRGHLTGREAGEHAQRAHARSLVLTHISDESDREFALAQAREVFDGPVTLAAQNDVFDLDASGYTMRNARNDRSQG